MNFMTRPEIRHPNFFILGAPKCGTTSLTAWLGTHPSIFIPLVKEPHFFNTDDKLGVPPLAAYEDLFAAVGAAHRAVGEASVWYFSSAVAVANILRYQPQARFVVMLRNPVEMAPALHAEMVLAGHENIRDFRAAWDLQGARRRGERLPALSWARRRLLYGEVCLLGAQLARLLGTVPAERVLAVLLEDMARAPRGEYLRVLDFLGVADDGRAAFPVHNPARVLRHPDLTRALFLASQVKNRLGVQLHLDLWRRLSAVNVTARPRPPLSTDTLAMLGRHFTADVALLGRLLDRDLRHWLDAAALGARPQEPAFA